MIDAVLPLTRPDFDQSELDALAQCLASCWVTQGPLTREFERIVAVHHEARHALATTSCTSALHLAAMALELGPGDEVVVPAFTWVTSANCAEYVGAQPRFVDVDEATFNIDPKLLAEAITPQTKAIVAVHLFGLAAPMDEILVIAKRHGIRVIEDAACAIGSRYGGRPVGVIGDIGCFSFHPRKVVTTGEGGMVTTNDDGLAKAVAALRNHGATGLPADDPRAEKPWTMSLFDRLGYNLRLSDIQAAVGVAQFKKLGRLLAERQARAQRYDVQLAELSDLALPPAGKRAGDHTYQSYVVRLRAGGRTRRNALMERLAAAGIQTRPGTHAVHRLGYYREKYGLCAEQFPVAAQSEDTTVTLPIFPGMTDAQQDRIVECVRRFLA
jgi:perosamine synthetase